MIERFLGDDGNRRLRCTLTEQSLVHGNSDLASRVADIGRLTEFATGEIVIKDGSEGNEIHLILTGTVDVVVNQRVVASRKAGQHVGEMALIDPSAPRCATLIATNPVVTCAVDEADFNALAEDYPKLWQRIALELANRLRHRNTLVIPPNPRAHLFIGSSVESLPVARAIQLGLEHDNVTVKVWTDGVFSASSSTIAALEREVRTADFGLMVFAPNDKVISRNVVESAPRDNVVLELGMCLGALAHTRTFFILPRGTNLKIPTDLLGITPLTYQVGAEGDLDAALGPVCEQLRRKISIQGVK